MAHPKLVIDPILTFQVLPGRHCLYDTRVMSCHASHHMAHEPHHLRGGNNNTMISIIIVILIACRGVILPTRG